MKRTAVITGASSGIGRELARTMHRHGSYDELWAIARNHERLEELKNELDLPVRTISMDLQRPEAVDELRALLEAEKPDIALLINAGGFGKFDAAERTPLGDSLGMIDLNCRALTAVTLLCLPYMSRGAEIIEIASVAAFQPIPYINIYAASKAYVLSFSRALNRELKGRGIRAFAVCPFWTKTRFFDRAVRKEGETVVKKYTVMYEPEFIARYTWKAMKHRRRDYCVPGFKARMQVLLVKILPHRMVMNIWQRQQGLR